MPKTTQKTLMKFLESEGHSAARDERGISFFTAGSRHVLQFDDDDDFVLLAIPDFWQVDTPQERRRALEAAVETASRVKCGKIVIVGAGSVWAAFESLSVDALIAVWPRALRILQTACAKFSREMEMRSRSDAPKTIVRA
jgi:hypothetical protein